MKQCWRWFGPDDPISLSDLPQVGVEGIVTSLYHLPPGIAWTEDEVDRCADQLRAAGYQWDVVESLPVSEAIKTQSSAMADHIDAYKRSLHVLASRGIQVICYNFMPILDWTRTSLRAPQPHGGTAMAFDLVTFATFDLHILKRNGATLDYPEVVMDAAKSRWSTMSEAEALSLQNTIIAGLPGANDTWSLDDVRQLLETYHAIDADRLRSNLIDFLSEVAPVAQDLGLRLCCHPDDPPFSLLGLPRVMSSLAGYEYMTTAVDLPANGVTFCTGSLGVSPEFDGSEFVRKLGPKIHFAHLRNTKRTAGLDPARPNFFEAPHLEGDTDMVATMQALMQEQARRKQDGREDWQIPMRPDHGQELLHDRGGHSLPGYPLIGRMRGLAELRGIMATCR